MVYCKLDRVGVTMLDHVLFFPIELALDRFATTFKSGRVNGRTTVGTLRLILIIRVSPR
jgi:hypothetical protein